jgi:hypothetical protein
VQLRGVGHPVAGAPVAGVIPRRGQAARVARAETRDELLVAQGTGAFGTAGHRVGRGRTEPKIGGCVENRDSAHTSPNNSD